MSSLSIANAERLDQLTGLRFLAALGVLFGHYYLLVPIEGLGFLAELGGHGVSLFFVLSGFVLTWRYEAEGAGRWFVGLSASQTKTYLMARIARIAPNYWFALSLTLVVYALMSRDVALGPAPNGWEAYAFALMFNVLALQAWVPDEAVHQYWNAPGWSVSAELFFYVCFPLLLRIRQLSGTCRSLVCVGIVFGVLLGGYLILMWFLGWWNALSLAFASRLPLLNAYAFVLGIVLCRRVRLVSVGRKGGSLGLIGAAFCLLVLAWLEAQGQGALTERSLALTLLLTHLFYVPLLAWLLFAVATNRGWVSRCLSTPTFVLLGNASFALYLLHWLPLGVLHRLADGRPVSFGVLALNVVCLMGASVLLYRWFETPLRRRLVDLASRRMR